MVILRKPRTSGRVPIIGVQDIGTRSSDGAGLRQVMATSTLHAATLDTAHFDAHPLFNFSDWTDASGNVFCEIPIAYWWRGNLPDTADGNTPRWTMLMSTHPGTVNINGTACTFSASTGAFKRGGTWMDKFYFGKYRGYNAGDNKVGSKSGEVTWGNVSFADFKTYCANNGPGYHMLSLQEWHEICARSVIEKATFQIMPTSIRGTRSSCKYRGIEDFAYSGTVYVEWADGAKTDGSAKYELWSEAGASFSSTGVLCPKAATSGYNRPQSIINSGLFSHLFLSSSIGDNATCFVPDLIGRIEDSVGRICSIIFNTNSENNGAFSSVFYNVTSDAAAHVGSRVCKW